jgi:hypothetical protein
VEVKRHHYPGVRENCSFAPLGLICFPPFPRLAPWAAFSRRFAAAGDLPKKKINYLDLWNQWFREFREKFPAKSLILKGLSLKYYGIRT